MRIGASTGATESAMESFWLLAPATEVVLLSVLPRRGVIRVGATDVVVVAALTTGICATTPVTFFVIVARSIFFCVVSMS